mmetsp:Transcript_50347/g.151619  ORF Transcript_50347/g.151619 Transcript_50347/m.151619 type:complete len:143 (+) Transcript_50347:279-707(+)
MKRHTVSSDGIPCCWRGGRASRRWIGCVPLRLRRRRRIRVYLRCRLPEQSGTNTVNQNLPTLTFGRTLLLLLCVLVSCTEIRIFLGGAAAIAMASSSLSKRLVAIDQEMETMRSHMAKAMLVDHAAVDYGERNDFFHVGGFL